MQHSKFFPSTWSPYDQSSRQSPEWSPSQRFKSSPRPLPATSLRAILNPEPQSAVAPGLSHRHVWHDQHHPHTYVNSHSGRGSVPPVTPIPCDAGVYETRTINDFNILIVNEKLKDYHSELDTFSPGYNIGFLTHVPLSRLLADEAQLDREPSPSWPGGSGHLHGSTPNTDFQVTADNSYPPSRTTRKAYNAAKLSHDRRSKRWNDIERERFKNTSILLLDSPVSSRPNSPTPPPHFLPHNHYPPTRSPSLSGRTAPRTQGKHEHLRPSSHSSSSSTFIWSSRAQMSSTAYSAPPLPPEPDAEMSPPVPSGQPIPHSTSTSIDPDTHITCNFAGCGERINMHDMPLGVHLNEKHRPRNQDRNANVTCLWEDCGQSVKWRNLRRHIMEYHLALLFKECSICEKTFSRSDALKRHERLYCPGRKNKQPRNTKPKAKLPYKPLTWRTTVDWKTGPRKPGTADAGGLGAMAVDDSDHEKEDAL